MARVVVVGGSGFYGRYLVADVLARTDADVVIASRAPEAVASSRVTTERVDLRNPGTLKGVLDGAAVVVHCAGPFETLPLGVLGAAISSGVPYVDVSENREFARRVLAHHDAAITAGIPVLTGASVAPGLALLHAREAMARCDEMESVQTFAAPDTRKHRGEGMFRTMLYGAGRAFEEPSPKGSRTRHGWAERRSVDFPAPLGRRWVYLVYGMADLDVIPDRVAPCTVRFWAGSEVEPANRMLALAALIRARWGHPQWERYVTPIRALSWAIGRFGRDEGGVVFEVVGRRKGEVVAERSALIGVPDGGRIPILLAAMAVEKVLRGETLPAGVRWADEWTTFSEVESACHDRQLPVWRSHGDHADWAPWSLRSPA